MIGFPSPTQPLVSATSANRLVTSAPQPSVGRIVHYHSYGTPNGEYLPEARAAIITEVPDLVSEGPNSGPDGYVQAARLCVLNPDGMFFTKPIPFSHSPKPGHWSFPPRV